MDNSELVVGLDIGTTKIVAIVGRKNEHGKIHGMYPCGKFLLFAKYYVHLFVHKTYYPLNIIFIILLVQRNVSLFIILISWNNMIIGVMTAHISMHGVTSLKGKRSVIKSLIGRLKSRFNISISEIEHQDNRSKAVIDIAIVSNDSRFIDQQFDSIIDFMRNDGRFILGQIEREKFS